MSTQETLTGRWSETLANTYGQPPLGLVSGEGAPLLMKTGKPTLTCWPVSPLLPWVMAMRR